MNKFFVIIGAIYCIASIDAVSLPKDEQKFTLRGRVVFPNGPRMPIESGGKLTVELQDVSLADAPARVIAQGTGQAIRFPMAFAIKYSSKQILGGATYSLRVNIKNKNNQLLYTNDVQIGVIPMGPNRTKFIDVPVIQVKKRIPVFEKRQWPELVGKNGQEAVNIIKQETGFTNVMTVREGSMVTMDYRTDRVRVFVNKQGIVTSVPNVS